MSASRPAVVVFAVGNPSRGDDALGPHLLAALEAWLAAEGRADVELIEDFQLNVEHSLDLEGRRLALFIDAGMQTPAPFSFTRLAPAPDLGASTHALEPAAVLRVFAQTSPEPPPAAYLLCVRGESFGLGEAMSAAASRHAEAAHALLRRLFSGPADFADWDRAEKALAVRGAE